MMRIIDAKTGREVKRGDFIPTTLDESQILPLKLFGVRENFFTAVALLTDESGRVLEQPLIVRYLHPHFFFQKVGFIPS